MASTLLVKVLQADATGISRGEGRITGEPLPGNPALWWAVEEAGYEFAG